tara:strand:- start:672 stop:1676 length:1005 start_codon:yes stop_codon:yes gene_type:complete
MKLAAIGDTHFRVDNINIVDILIEELIRILTERKPDVIVLLGDILHDHERLHTIALNRAYTMIDQLRKIAPTYILVGNHDMINHDQFLTDQHWMNALKMWPNVTIVDTVVHAEIQGYEFLFCPYVAPGRFVEALETNEFEWAEADLIFAHQEFAGCKMGAIVSEIGDEWELESPPVVSGHIHSKQTPQENIFYTGSSMQVAYGETEKNIVLMIDFSENEDGYSERSDEEIILDLPRKRILYVDSSEFENFTPPNDKDQIKLTVKGSYEDFKSLKKTGHYKKLISLGVKISYRHSKIEEVAVQKNDVVDFDKILCGLIEDEKNKFVSSAYKKINK